MIDNDNTYFRYFVSKFEIYFFISILYFLLNAASLIFLIIISIFINLLVKLKESLLNIEEFHLIINVYIPIKSNFLFFHYLKNKYTSVYLFYHLSFSIF